MRSDGRAADELRPVVIRPNFIKHAEGSVLIEVGDTRVCCTASVRKSAVSVSHRQGWITAGTLPRADRRTDHEAAKRAGAPWDQRLIGRALRRQ
jgi:ribonuclease PH